ncbi:carbohydrate binding domain-containing protein [Asticcacaulis solisilvae]|uniref:carbohydrate binding domain-containing protein n=1 Tax=Asticcacaulis solisilvae TaxID=1217274 RepID=UPI003FD6D3EC
MLPLKSLAVLTGIATALVFTAPAQAQDDITKHLVSNPNVGSWQIYGAAQTNKKIKDDKVQGGNAIEASATGVGESYAAAAQVDVNQKLTKGDHVVCAVWLKAKTPASTTLHGRLQMNSAPYTGVMEKDFAITDQWQLYSVEGDIDQDYDKGKLVFAVHLNGAKQTVDLGPAFVLNMSRTY